MTRNAKRDRRAERAQGFRLHRSLYMRVPISIAAPVLGLAAVLTAATDYLAPRDIWLGPVYLLIAALAAWFVSSRFAIGLGVAVIVINLLAGKQSTYPYGPDQFSLNFGLRILCVLAVAAMLGRARKSLEREWRLARTDPLTGVLNRQAFFEALKVETGMIGPALLVFADVDGLKHVNDKLGHEVGDVGLWNFTGRVRKAIRKDDLFARIGGDEFVVYMKVKDEQSAKTVAERLNKVLNVDADANVHEVALKCSLGILFLPAGSQSIDAELKLADKLMYSAKRVRAGVLMASALQLDTEKKQVSALATALPINPNSIVRHRADSAISLVGGALAPSAASRDELPAI